MTSLKCSVIIPSYNTRDLTLRCIGAILQHPPSGGYEIIVVDNHSSDGTIAAVQTSFPTVKAIQNERNLGFSKACNRGASVAAGEYLLFLNSDTEAQRETFDRLIRWLDEHPKTGIVGPELLGDNHDILQMSWVWNPLLQGELIQQYFAPYAIRQSPFRKRLVRFLQSRSGGVPSICGACLMIRRKAFDQVQGFDEDFELYFEDSDLCLRCKQAGWQIDFVADSKIIHHLGQSTRGSWNITSLIYQQSHLRFYRKHAPRWAVDLLQLYLRMKCARLDLVTAENDSEKRLADRYRSAYRKMIRGSIRLTLEEGIPQ